MVGVVGDVRHQALERTGGSEMYLPMRQTPDYSAIDRGSAGPRFLPVSWRPEFGRRCARWIRICQPANSGHRQGSWINRYRRGDL